MRPNSQTDAILLLTASLGKADEAAAKPLSVNEWARFAAWLRKRGLQPHDLLQGDRSGLLSGWADKAITSPRLESLLGRGTALALLLEKWQRAGLRVITRADAEYPALLKERLKAASPPVLFVSGNAALLNNGGIAVVGSRNATDDDCRFTAAFAARASAQGYSVVSGGARGVDQSAMLGALENDGTAVGVLSAGLLADASSAKYRRFIMAGDLTLISPFNPEAGFTVGNAMGRNRYIYCLANAAVVIRCDTGKGGTWNGAVENLKARWIPLWVKKNGQSNSGNHELTMRGARCLPEELPDLGVLLDGDHPETGPALPGLQEAFPEIPPAPSVPSVAGGESGEIPDGLDFYQLFLKRMERLTIDRPLASGEIAITLKVRRKQVEDWLKWGMEEDRIEKLTKPVRYRLRTEEILLYGGMTTPQNWNPGGP